jgi:hypothetical protein
MIIFCGRSVKGMGWFRLFGVGVSWKDTRVHPLVFSERLGSRKGLRVGPWIFHFLAYVPPEYLKPPEYFNDP